MKHFLQTSQLSLHHLQRSRELYKKEEGRFEEYMDRLLEWNSKINLVSRSVSRETLREHIVHSLIPLSLNLLSDFRKWIDAGSGGGLPGVPIAISEKGLEVVLNDNIKKKMMAVNDILSKMELSNVQTIDKSISLVGLKKGTGIMSKHAFKIPKLLHLLKGKPWERIILWKGVDDAEQELIAVKEHMKAHIYHFDFGADEPFYEGKGLVVLQR